MTTFASPSIAAFISYDLLVCQLNFGFNFTSGLTRPTAASQIGIGLSKTHVMHRSSAAMQLPQLPPITALWLQCSWVGYSRSFSSGSCR